MLVLVASSHVLNATSTSEDIDGWDKPDHDECDIRRAVKMKAGPMSDSASR
jgi:hypothetical protein